MKKVIVGSLLVLMMVGLQIGDWTNVAQAQSSPAIRIGMDVDADLLDPRLARNTTGFRVNNLIYDGLVELDPTTLEPEPSLAVSWSQPDSTTWVFNLREDAVLHDGTPLTATDVVSTFEAILDPDFGAPDGGLYAPLTSVVALDEHTVEFRASQPYAPLLSYLDKGIVPQHVIEAGGDIANEPVGSGPFRFVEWEKNSRIVVEANPDWWGGQPNIDGVEFVVVGDNTARAQALEAGDLDLVQTPLSPQDISRLADDERFNNTITAGFGYTYLNFQTAFALFENPNVRRALTMLVPQQTIVEDIYEGIDLQASSILLPNHFAFSGNVQQPSENVEEALELLASEGWTDSNGDGILDKDGQDFSFVLTTHTEDPNRVQTVEFLQNVFTQNGLDVSLNIQPFNSLLPDILAGNYELLLIGWLNLVDPDRAMFNQLHSNGTSNWGNYSNPDVDAALDAGRTALTIAGRTQAYQNAARVIADEVPYFVLQYQGFHQFKVPELQNFVPDARGHLRSLATATF